MEIRSTVWNYYFFLPFPRSRSWVTNVFPAVRQRSRVYPCTVERANRSRDTCIYPHRVNSLYPWQACIDTFLSTSKSNAWKRIALSQIRLWRLHLLTMWTSCKWNPEQCMILKIPGRRESIFLILTRSEKKNWQKLNFLNFPECGERRRSREGRAHTHVTGWNFLCRVRGYNKLMTTWLCGTEEKNVSRLIDWFTISVLSRTCSRTWIKVYKPCLGGGKKSDLQS